MSDTRSPSVQQTHEDERRYAGGLVYFVRNALGLSAVFVATLSLVALVMGGGTAGIVWFAPPVPEGAQMRADNRFVRMFIEQQVEAQLEEPEAVENEPAEEEDEAEALVEVTPAPEPEPEPEPEPPPIEEPPAEEPPPADEEQVAEAAAEPPAGDFGVEALGGNGAGGGGPAINLPTGGNPNGTFGARRESEVQERTQERTEDRSARREERSRSDEDAARVMRLDEVGAPPEVVSQDPPIGYPRELREQAIAGLVVVECLITDRGSVRACRHRDGPDELAEYVMSIVRNWRFNPARDHDGNAVVVNYTFRIPFRLT